MDAVILKGVITPEGKLELDLPADLPPGPVEVEIRQKAIPAVRLGDLLHSELVGLWADRDDIGDSVEFARELRRRAAAVIGAS